MDLVVACSGIGHAFDEWYENVDAYLGLQNTFMTILGLVGVDGVTQPLLEVRAKQLLFMPTIFGITSDPVCDGGMPEIVGARCVACGHTKR